MAILVLAYLSFASEQNYHKLVKTHSDMQSTPTYVILVPKNKWYVYSASQYAPCIIAVKNNAKYLNSKKKSNAVGKKKKDISLLHTYIFFYILYKMGIVY